MDKLCIDGVKCPEIANLEKITPEQAAEYVRFVALMRHNQRRFFATRKPDALEASKRMEAELDKLNAYLLDPTPRLF